MESKLLAVSPKLRGALAWIMAEAFELGYIPAINNTQSRKSCLVLSNRDSGKIALLGTMTDDQGDPVLTACTVSIKNWLWAEDEGFARDEIIDNNKLYRKIFKKVPVEALPWILA